MCSRHSSSVSYWTASPPGGTPTPSRLLPAPPTASWPHPLLQLFYVLTLLSLMSPNPPTASTPPTSLTCKGVNPGRNGAFVSEVSWDPSLILSTCTSNVRWMKDEAIFGCVPSCLESPTAHAYVLQSHSWTPLPHKECSHFSEPCLQDDNDGWQWQDDDDGMMMMEWQW